MPENKKIKILHIITRLDKGGSADIAFTIASSLNRAKYKITLISGLTRNEDAIAFEKMAKRQDIDLVFIPELMRRISLINDLKAFLKLYRLIKNGEYNIVHTHSSKAGILGRWAACFVNCRLRITNLGFFNLTSKIPPPKSIKIIHMPHGHIFYGYYGYFKTIFFILLEAITAFFTDRIITLTCSGKRDHIKYGIGRENKFVPIYNGIDLDRYKNVQIDRVKKKEELGIYGDSFVVADISRLDPVKGNRYFIEAINRVTRYTLHVTREVRFLVVGDGSEREMLEKMAEKYGIMDKVIFTGMRNDIPEILAVSDLVVLPSLMEGLGIVLLEAMAAGRPVVATWVGGVPEIVKDGETGFLVPPKNSKAIADAIIALLADEDLRKRMGKAGRSWVNEMENGLPRFSIEAMVRKIERLYKEVLGAI